MQSTSKLVFVAFVGGPCHGQGMLVANPEFTMLLGESGEEVCYCSRSVERSQSPDNPDLVFYAPNGMSEGGFDALIEDDSNYAAVRRPSCLDVRE